MPVYALKTQKARSVQKWLKETKARSKEGNMLKNPFMMEFRSYSNKSDLILLCKVKPLYPNVSIMGWISAFAIVFVWGWHWVLWPCIILGMLGYFWTSEFYATMTRIALRRKAKYTGPIKRLRLAKFIEEVLLKNGTTRLS